MSTLNISIPESMKAYIEEQAREGEFTTSEYIRHLIRADQEQRERRAQLAQYLAFGEAQIARGEFVSWDKEKMLKKIKQDYKKAHTTTRKK